MGAELDEKEAIASTFAAIGKFWAGLDTVVKRVILIGFLAFILYWLVSPLQQCKREQKERGYRTSWCYANTSW